MRNLALLAASAAFILPTVASANLLTNGGFDTIVNGPTSGYKTLFAGNTDITGWLVGGVSVDVTVFGSYPVVSNPYSIDLAGTPGPGSVSQTLTGLTSHLYTFSFSGQTNQSGIYGEVVASIGATSQTFQLTNTFQTYTFSAMASGTTTFTLATNPSNTGNGNIFVDNAAVAVPGPASLASFGLMALGGLRRRAKRA